MNINSLNPARDIEDMLCTLTRNWWLFILRGVLALIIAVQAFLDNQITFAGIWHTVEAVMSRHHVIAKPTLDQINATDHWSR